MLSKNQLGFFYMFISVCAFSLMDVIVKWSDDYPVGQVLFFRGFCGIIPILFLIPKNPLKNKTSPTGYSSDHLTITSINENAHTEMNM